MTPADSLGPLERRVMDHLWHEARPATVRDVRNALGGRLAYTTLMTTLDRLHKKGLLDRRRDGKAFVYSPRLSRGEFHGGLLRRLLDRALGGGASATPVLSSLVDTVGEHDRELLDQLERLVQRKRRSGSPPGGAR
jgi:predicted transcriptional regulator